MFFLAWPILTKTLRQLLLYVFFFFFNEICYCYCYHWLCFSCDIVVKIFPGLVLHFTQRMDLHCKNCLPRQGMWFFKWHFNLVNQGICKYFPDRWLFSQKSLNIQLQKISSLKFIRIYYCSILNFEKSVELFKERPVTIHLFSFKI